MVSYFFAFPSGAVWGNIAAEPIIAALTLLAMWPFRHKLMARFVAFHHTHKMAHLERLRETPRGTEKESQV